jgi:hypothetical protein
MQKKKAKAAKKKPAKKVKATSPDQGVLGQKFEKSLEQESREMTRHAKELLEVAQSKRNLLEVGQICYAFKSNEARWSCMGYKSFDEWRMETFGAGAKIAYRNQRIFENDIPYLTEREILNVGQVKAYEFSRLPESERKKKSWKEAVLHDDTATFKTKIRAFLKGSPDHQENFGTISIVAPNSLRQVHKRVYEGYRNVLRSDEGGKGFDEDWQVHEAILQEIEQANCNNPNWAHPEADKDADDSSSPEAEPTGTEQINAGLNAPAEQEQLAGVEPKDVCKNCNGEFPVAMEPANFVRGKMRKLEKAPLKVRKLLKGSFGFLCGDCYFQLTGKEEPVEEESEAVCAATVQ